MSETARRRKWPYVLGGFVLIVAILVAVFRWDWLIPIVEAQASTALGRKVTLQHLHVQLGRTTHIVADGVVVGNPADWPGGGDMAAVKHLLVDVDAMAFIHGRHIVLPSIGLQQPKIDAEQLEGGKANWQFASASSASSGGGGEQPQIGALNIDGGSVHFRSVPLKGDLNIAVSTKTGGADGHGQIVADAKGTYAGQPILASFAGGALLSLRDAQTPYPIDLKVENGPTKVAIQGTVQNPLAFAGADVRLELSGPDMSLLLPLTGIAIPKTPPYRVAGKLDYANGVVKFDDIAGKVGSSDLEGDLGVDTKPQRPVLTANLRSKMVDLKDLAGFIGAEPGDASKGTKKPVRSDGKVLPNDPISLPKLNVADVHLTYSAGRIEGRNQPLDDMAVKLDIVDGNIAVHPLTFKIGFGKIASDIDLSQRGAGLAAKADIHFDRVDVATLLNATGIAKGAGAISGEARIDGHGRSMAEILADGDGELRLYMGAGGNVSALIVDLSGLQFGNALLSALGVPNRESIQCLVTDFVLKDGLANSRLTMLDTNDSRLGIIGGVNLRTEAMNFMIRTEAKHFSVGSLPTPIGVQGTLGNPSINVDLKEGGARAAAAVGLGVVLTPLASILPTIQFGSGEDHACASLVKEVQAPPRMPAPARGQRRR